MKIGIKVIHVKIEIFQDCGNVFGHPTSELQILSPDRSEPIRRGNRRDHGAETERVGGRDWFDWIWLWDSIVNY